MNIQPSKVFSNLKTIFILAALYLLTLSTFYACNNQSTNQTQSNNKTSQPTMQQEDKELIKAIIDQLSKDYAPIMGMYEMELEEFATDKAKFISNYKSVLDKMSYMDQGFKTNLIQKLEKQVVGKDMYYIRPLVDPLFEANQVANQLIIKGYDIEEDMASVGVELLDANEKKSCCYSELFFKKIQNEWKLTGHDISESIRESHRQKISPENYLGLYIHETDSQRSYNIKKSEGEYILEYCEEKCNDIGSIESIKVTRFGDYKISIKGLTGEMIPQFHIDMGTLRVREYNAGMDKWEDNEYNFTEGQG